MWPLGQLKASIPTQPHTGAFGARRRYDVHTGVDLYCDPGTPVHAIESGVVVGKIQFTGHAVGSPWWNDTWALLVEGASGVIVYGEIDIQHSVESMINEGDVLGHVLRVLKHDKGKPTSMLHVELYVPGTRDVVTWGLDEPKSIMLLDPTDLLRKSL